MSELKGKIDFTLFISAWNANPNGDPLNGNRPRINLDGHGEISDVCIKRKIRNRLQDLGQKIFVQFLLVYCYTPVLLYWLPDL